MLKRFSLTTEEENLFISLIFENPLWKDADRGFGYRDVLFYDTLKELPEKLRKVFYASVARYDFEERFMPYNEGIEELIFSLKRNGYNIYLLSNIGFGFHIFNMKMPVFKHFDGMFGTCDCGHIKPEREVFDAFCSRFGLVPAECIFIDDSTENIKAGIEAGFTAFTYNALNEDICALREKLVSYGINAD